MTFTIELPDDLVGEFQKEQIPDEELKAVVIAALEVWLEQRQAANAGVESKISAADQPFSRLAKRHPTPCGNPATIIASSGRTNSLDIPPW